MMIQLRKPGDTCHPDDVIGRKRVVRGTLGTRYEDVAHRFVHSLEIAVYEGDWRIPSKNSRPGGFSSKKSNFHILK
jgi:hypothetical protein